MLRTKPPTMKRRRMRELKPWIEKLILNYGQVQRTSVVKAGVVSVCEISVSQQTDHVIDGACMLFVSDGSAVIPAVLTHAAWDDLLDTEDLDSFSSLCKAIVFLRCFELNFDMNHNLESCQFYLKVNQITILCITSKCHNRPSCTTIPSVRDQIERTWRSQREDSIGSASGVTLSLVLEAWHNDVIRSVLDDAMKKITVSATYCPSVVTPTHWHRERLHWRGQEQFIVPVPFLLVPEEQRELMTADPGVEIESEGQNILALPTEEPCPVSTWSENQTVATQDDRGGSCPDEGPSSLEHTNGPEVLCGTADLSGDGESPWDMYTQEPALLERPSTSDLNEPESQSLLKEVPSLPLATSTQAAFSKQISVDGITLGQRPKTTQFRLSRSGGDSVTDPSQEPMVASPPSWLHHNTALTSEQRPRAPAPHKPAVLAKARKVHTDGKAFSYSYHSQPRVARALGHFQVPGHVVQWAVRYLGTSDCTDVNAGSSS